MYLPGELIEKDEERERAIAVGLVPETCRLGGSVLAGFAARGADPCFSCAMPREHCGGRPRAAASPISDGAAWVALDAAAAYADLRRLQAQALDEHAKDLAE